MEIVENKNQQKITLKYACTFCDYSTNRKHNFNTHLNSKKHSFCVNLETQFIKIQQNPENLNLSESEVFECGKCDKSFKSRSGLWKHCNKCFKKTTNSDQTHNLIVNLIKENSEFKEMLMHQNKTFLDLASMQHQSIVDLSHKQVQNVGNTNIGNATITNMNKPKFNLNFFLNETCKDAMNIMDFVDQVEITFQDLEETGRLGYAEGMSKIIVNALDKIKESCRPIHCSDLKREVLYVKDNDVWCKDQESKDKLLKAVKHISHKNFKKINEWAELHPGCKESDSRNNEKYLNIVGNSMSGGTDGEATNNYGKILKTIMKRVVIAKCLGWDK